MNKNFLENSFFMVNIYFFQTKTLKELISEIYNIKKIVNFSY